MDTFTLHIRRESAFTAMAAVTKVIIDGGNVTNLRSGGSHDVVLPRKPVNVVLLNQVPMGKDIQEVVTIDPRDSSEVTLLFKYKFNPKMLLPFGAFTQQQSFIKTEVIYGPSVGSASSAYASAQASQPLTPKTEGSKFCTECGMGNPKEAKFCRECGHKF